MVASNPSSVTSMYVIKITVGTFIGDFLKEFGRWKTSARHAMAWALLRRLCYPRVEGSPSNEQVLSIILRKSSAIIHVSIEEALKNISDEDNHMARNC